MLLLLGQFERRIYTSVASDVGTRVFAFVNPTNFKNNLLYLTRESVHRKCQKHIFFKKDLQHKVERSHANTLVNSPCGTELSISLYDQCHNNYDRYMKQKCLRESRSRYKDNTFIFFFCYLNLIIKSLTYLHVLLDKHFQCINLNMNHIKYYSQQHVEYK